MVLEIVSFIKQNHLIKYKCLTKSIKKYGYRDILIIWVLYLEITDQLVYHILRKFD